MPIPLVQQRMTSLLSGREVVNLFEMCFGMHNKTNRHAWKVMDGPEGHAVTTVKCEYCNVISPVDELLEVNRELRTLYGR